MTDFFMPLMFEVRTHGEPTIDLMQNTFHLNSLNTTTAALNPSVSGAIPPAVHAHAQAHFPAHAPAHH